MIVLSQTTDNLQIVLAGAVTSSQLVCLSSWRDITTTDYTAGRTVANSNSTTDSTIVAAPASSTQRVVDFISVYNTDSAAATATIKFDANGTEYFLWKGTINSGESVQYAEGRGWYVLGTSGAVRTQATDKSGYTGRLVGFQKTGTAADAVGYWYCTSKDAGFPGAWAVGTPGLGGRATDGTVAADFGCIPFTNAATGAMYLTNGNITSSVAHWHMLFDCLWVNSGIVVTTTTAQTINSVAFPARDLTGTVNGVGCLIGLLFTGTATNVAVNNTATVTYTNQSGTGSRTATLVNQVGHMIPATALVGTLVWFRLAAGDIGVQSIQSITLATSLGAGSVSLIVARPVLSVPAATVNVGGYGVLQDQSPGIRLYDGSCILHCYQASATTATMVSGTITMMER